MVTKEYFQLILDKFDGQAQDIKDLFMEIKEIQRDVVEIKSNHLPHLAQDIALLQQDLTNLKGGQANALKYRVDTDKGKWRLWAAGLAGVASLIGIALAAWLA